MTTFPSIYRAKAVKISPTSVTAFVPQVFGDVPIEITDFVDRPGVTGMGWVFFQAGNSDFPVWTAGVDGVTGSVGGVTEVSVGTDDPVGRNPSVVMWYDSDQPTGALKVLVGGIWVTVTSHAALTGLAVGDDHPQYAKRAEFWSSQSFSTAAGKLALSAIVFGETSNTAVGHQALRDSTTASNSTAVGKDSGRSATTAFDNVGVGTFTLAKNLIGSYNTALGSQALANLVAGSALSYDTAVGFNTGSQVITGVDNVFLGAESDLKDAVQANGTIAIGRQAHTKGDFAIAIGRSAEATATESIAIGHGVTTAVASEIKLGGAGHTVNIPGSFKVTSIQALDSGGTPTTLSINAAGGVIQLGSGNPQQVRIGNDAYFTDVNVANTLALQGVADSTTAILQVGSTAKIIGTSNYLQLVSVGNQYVDFASGSTCNWRRTNDFVTLMSIDSAGSFTAYGLTSNGNISAASNITAGGQIYAGTSQWFRVRGNTGIYWEDWGGGWNMQDSTWMRVYNSKGIYTPGEIRGGALTCESYMALSAFGNSLFMGPSSDANHRLYYSSMPPSSVHPSSGIGSNGPVLWGYATSIIGTAAGQPYTNMLMNSNGDCFNHAGWKQFSQRKLKLDPKALDPEACLLQVRRWEPIEYTPIYPVNGARRDGFVVEDLYEVTPTVCNVIEEALELPGETENDREWRLRENATREIGTPNAIDYPALVVRLTGALQALADRIDALETQLEGASS